MVTEHNEPYHISLFGGGDTCDTVSPISCIWKACAVVKCDGKGGCMQPVLHLYPCSPDREGMLIFVSWVPPLDALPLKLPRLIPRSRPPLNNRGCTYSGGNTHPDFWCSILVPQNTNSSSNSRSSAPTETKMPAGTLVKDDMKHLS